MENNLNNLPPFYIGQKVVRLSTKQTYTVKSILRENCGCYAIDIGLTEGESTDLLFCDKCNSDTIVNNNNIFYLYPSALAPIQGQTFPLLTYSKVIEKELVSAN